MARRNRHVVVVGGGLGGLSAAIHLRLAGHQVLVIEQGAIGGKAAQIHQEGFTLDPGPSILILPEIYRSVFRKASRDPDQYLKFQRLNPVTRVFFEGWPFIDLPDGLDSCLDVAASISNDDANALRNLFGVLDEVAPLIEQSVFKAPIHSPLQLLSPSLAKVGMRFAKFKNYKTFIDENFSSPLFKAFFYGFPSYGGQTYDGKGMGSLLIPYFMLKRGVFYAEGGVGAIPQSFERLARELGVEFRVGERVSKILLEGGHTTGVEIESRETIACDAVVCNVDRLTAARDLLGQRVEARPSMSYFTVHWGIRGRLKDSSHHMLLIPTDFEKGFEALYRRKEFPEPPIVYLNVTSELDPSTAPPGCTNLFAVVSSPANEPNLEWDRVQVSARASILKALRDRGWELAEEDIVFERIQTPRTFEKAHGNYMGSLYGPEESARLFGGLFPLRCKDEKISGLFYAGGSVQPGAGLPMVTLSGQFAAELVDRS